MRIDNNGRPEVTSIRGTEAAGHERGEVGRGRERRGDSLELSGLASAVRSLSLRLLSDDTSARAIRMQELKEAVQDGRFNPDPRATAEAMLDRVPDDE
ncbi:MAG: flagellar biosynthesis anti-sigma factor FlgM [Acidobacteriota bacterium]